jgi:hypothetical protein
MKQGKRRTTEIFGMVLIISLMLSGCVPHPSETSDSQSIFPSISNTRLLTDASEPQNPLWQPVPGTTWQYQLNTPIDLAFEAEVFSIDLFDNDTATVEALHNAGRKAICYINTGAWEDWRPDADQFPESLLGNAYVGWSGERWLDIRQIDKLAPILNARLDLCQSKGFDGVDPDNMNGYLNNTGFPLSFEDQLRFNQWLSQAAHQRSLSIGIKNTGEQAIDLLPFYDWAVVESCFSYNECQLYTPFIDHNKAVFSVEYTSQKVFFGFCPQAEQLRFSLIRKPKDLSAPNENCP